MDELKFNSIEDIIEYAITEEEAASIYYSEQAKKSVKVELRAIWLQLANDEMRHKALLSNILEKLENGEKGSFSRKDMPDFVELEIPEKEYDELGKAIIEAAYKENDAHYMYKNLALKLEEQAHIDILNTLSLEELKHRDTLMKELNFI